jgi:hypothetical protein
MLRSLFPVAVPLQLADVVHEAKHHPRSVDLGSATVLEAFEPVHVADIGENRLHDPQTLGVLVASLIRVDLALHLLGVGEELL